MRLLVSSLKMKKIKKMSVDHAAHRIGNSGYKNIVAARYLIFSYAARKNNGSYKYVFGSKFKNIKN